MMMLSDHDKNYEFKKKKKSGKYLPPFHEIFVQEIPIQNGFDQNILFVNGFSKFLLLIFRQTERSVVPRKYPIYV